MNLHEYQAKALFAAYGMPVPNNLIAHTPAQARAAAETFSTEQVVVKAQVHAGGRGKAGGVKIVDTPREAEDYAKSMLGTHFVTAHTSTAGQPVNAILVEEICLIDNELYLGMIVEPAQECVFITASTQGGMELEQVMRNTPDKILKVQVDSGVGITPEQSAGLALQLGLSGEQGEQFIQLLERLYSLFIDKELALVEISPLVVTAEGNLVCLDGKIIVDNSSLERHPDIAALRDETQEIGFKP